MSKAEKNKYLLITINKLQDLIKEIDEMLETTSFLLFREVAEENKKAYKYSIKVLIDEME